MNDSSKIVGCDPVNNHISTPIPSTLWHYTSYAAFEKIVDSKTIWATEYRFLNDREEFRHARELAQKLVDDEPEFTGAQFHARETIRNAVNIAFYAGHLHEERLRIMVASFSEEGDQLSQWRAYTDSSRGISLGLDLSNLRPPPNIGTAVTFAPCVYDMDDKSALLKAAFAHFRDGVQAWWDSIVDVAGKRKTEGAISGPGFGQRLVSEHSKELRDVVNHYQASLQFDLLRIAPLLKDESFFEEREWRLVLPLENIMLPTKHTIEFRPIRDALVPYIAYPLTRSGQDGPIFCRDLVLGPGSHPFAKSGIDLFFEKRGIRVLARPSKIPYRAT